MKKQNIKKSNLKVLKVYILFWSDAYCCDEKTYHDRSR